MGRVKKETFKTGAMYIGLFLTVILLAGCGNAVTSQKAYADTLAAGATSITLEQKESDTTKNLKSFMKKDGYSDFLQGELALVRAKIKFNKVTDEYEKTGEKYLTKHQVAELEKNRRRVLNAHCLVTINEIGDDSKRVVNEASTLKDTRSKVGDILTKHLRNGSDILTSAEKKKIRDGRLSINSTYSIERLNLYKEKSRHLYDKAKERKRKEEERIRQEEERRRQEEAAAAYRASLASNIPMDTTYWTLEKLEYVNYGGAKNNSFLAGTPMEGLGYYIVHKAYDFNCDPALLTSIANQESGCGVAPYGCAYNAYGGICMTPPMYSGEDGIDKWYDFFGPYFQGDIPVQSMHGYGGYGVDSNLFAYAHNGIGS